MSVYNSQVWGCQGPGSGISPGAVKMAYGAWGCPQWGGSAGGQRQVWFLCAAGTAASFTE